MLLYKTNQTGEYIHANTLQTITFRPAGTAVCGMISISTNILSLTGQAGKPVIGF